MHAIGIAKGASLKELKELAAWSPEASFGDAPCLTFFPFAASGGQVLKVETLLAQSTKIVGDVGHFDNIVCKGDDEPCAGAEGSSVRCQEARTI